MKRTVIVLSFLLCFIFSLQAQVDKYDYQYFCDKLMAEVDNSVPNLEVFYRDLKTFEKSPASSRFRYFEQYNSIQQPDQVLYNKIKSGPPSPIKTIGLQMWKLYNDCYAKAGEIVVYVRLEDYKTDVAKGFTLIKEMQQLHLAIGALRDQVAVKVVNDSKSLPASNVYTKPYQLLLKAIIHEELLINKLSQNFNEERFIGYPRKEILSSYLEMDDIMKALKGSAFGVTDRAYLRSTIEGLELIQKTKKTSLDGFNNSSTFDGEYLNQLYENLRNYFNNDILHFYSNFAAQARLGYYPVSPRRFDFTAPAVQWSQENLDYTLLSLDSVSVKKQPAPLQDRGFAQLNNINAYLEECVFSMARLFKALRHEETTWGDINKGKMPYKNPVLKYDKFTVPVTIHGMVIKESDQLPALYRRNLVDRINDIESAMLSLQDHLIALSLYMRTGEFRGKAPDYINKELITIESLYNELDIRKEKLFLLTREVYSAFPPKKSNSWLVASSALLKAADDSRKILKDVGTRVYKNDSSPVSADDIHEDQRDLIINQMKYMKGIVRIGSNSGLDPYTPYEYIPDYLKTLEEKVTEFPDKVNDADKIYGDFLYMHNIIVEKYNKFAELALDKDNEYSRNDPMRPVNILSYIRQPPKYHYEQKKPKAEDPDVFKVRETKSEPVQEPEPVSFEGYAFNNLVLLLDVSSSMNVPERLPLLKKSVSSLVPYMRPEDRVSIVIYSGKATLHLPSVSASDTTAILNAIRNLKSEGKTNVADGLELAYKTANRNFIENGNNKIIMATDGEFNTGESLYRLVEKNLPKITLTVFDFSQREEIVKPIQQLAERGTGNYVKVTADNSLEVLTREMQKTRQ